MHRTVMAWRWREPPDRPCLEHVPNAIDGYYFINAATREMRRRFGDTDDETVGDRGRKRDVSMNAAARPSLAHAPPRG